LHAEVAQSIKAEEKLNRDGVAQEEKEQSIETNRA
jgi:hypothetical protein